MMCFLGPSFLAADLLAGGIADKFFLPGSEDSRFHTANYFCLISFEENDFTKFLSVSQLSR